MSSRADWSYLDHAATTPVDPRVHRRMASCMEREGTFGNPSSVHPWGRAAAAMVDQAAAQVADLIQADPAGVVWTSGATEADNLAILGAARFAANRDRGRHVISARTEHAAVLEPLQQLEREGMEVTLLPPEADGRVTPDAVADALRDDTVLVSLMHVNNEIGTVQDIAGVGEVLRDHPTRFHVDAAQSAGRLPIKAEAWGVDLLSLSAHKVYGPKGVGALWVRHRPRVRLEPLLFGGGQQSGLRPGTLAPHLIAGMGEACAIAAEELPTEAPRLAALRERLLDRLMALDAVVLNGQRQGCPHVLNLSFGCVNGDALQAELDGLGVSAGSACSSSERGPSHVLRALGVPDALAHSSLRFSPGRWTTEADVDQAAALVAGAVERLRAFSPAWREFGQGARLDELYGGNPGHAQESKA